MGHGFSRQITEKCITKYENGNYILGHPKWKWELYFGTEWVFAICYLLLPPSQNIVPISILVVKF